MWRTHVPIGLALALAAGSAAAGDGYSLWLLDDGQGDVAVDGGAGAVDMAIANPRWLADGPFPGAAALSFDGSGQTRATCEGPGVGEQGTIELWLRPRRLEGTQALFSTKFTSTSRLMLGLNNGDLFASDQWWAEHHEVVAPGALGPTDLGTWVHLALSWGPAGYRLYRNGQLLARQDGSPFPSRPVVATLGINSWDLQSCRLDGDLAQVRLSAAVLEPGAGSGRGELAWRAALDHARILRPTLRWLEGPNASNLFVRDARPVLTLQVVNRFREPLPVPAIRVVATDRYLGTDLAPLDIALAEPLAPRGRRDLEVDPGLTRAGSYRVVAAGPGDSTAATTIAWVRGDAPEEPEGPVPFFATCSHDPIIAWAYEARREFGSRMERDRVYWHAAQDGEASFRWTPNVEDDPVVKVIVAEHGSACGFTGYTPAFASTAPPEQVNQHDVPDLTAYARWVEAAARRYQGIIRHWEIWNEPNGDGTFFRGTAEQLADLHKVAFLAVKRVDPALQIIGASLVSVDPQYLDRLDDAGALDYMDVLAFHNYVWARPPEPTVLANLDRMLAWRDEHAPGRPLWDFEWGYDATDGDLRRHAAMTAAQLILSMARGIQSSAFYTWSWHSYHLLDGYIPEPAAIAYRTVAQRLTNARPVCALSEGAGGIYAYLFRRREVLSLVAWASGPGGGATLAVPVDAGRVARWDLMGNPVATTVADGSVALTLDASPQFLEGVSPAHADRGWPLPAAELRGPEPRHPRLWFSFHYPRGSEVFPLPHGTTRRLTVRVHNEGPDPAAGVVRARSRSGRLRVAPDAIEVAVPARSSHAVQIEVSAPPSLPEGPERVDLSGEADGMSFGRMSIRCEVADGDVTAFHMATWEMAQHTVAAADYGQGIHIRWFQPGGHITFRFDLSGSRSARLRGYMDSISPALGDGGSFRILASRDDKHWDTLLEDRGPWAWREVDLAAYAGAAVLVRFEHPASSIAKGQARVREWRLLTRPAAAEQAQPTGEVQ